MNYHEFMQWYDFYQKSPFGSLSTQSAASLTTAAVYHAAGREARADEYVRDPGLKRRDEIRQRCEKRGDTESDAFEMLAQVLDAHARRTRKPPTPTIEAPVYEYSDT